MDSDRTSRAAVETSADLVGRTPNLARVLIKGLQPTAEMGVGCTSGGRWRECLRVPTARPALPVVGFQAKRPPAGHLPNIFHRSTNVSTNFPEGVGPTRLTSF